MPVYVLTGPDGKEYDVTADTMQQAVSDFKQYRQDQVTAQGRKEFEEAPWWGKLGRSAEDVARIGVDTASLGFADVLADRGTGDEMQRMLTKAARDRAGWAGTATDIGTAVTMLPTAVPKVLGMLGGGPAARTILGAGAGGIEGAAYGGASAVGHGEDIQRGTQTGGVTGILAQLAGSAVNKGKRTWDEVVRGKTFEAPKYDVRSTPPKPTPQQQVNVAASQAESRGRLNTDPAAQQKMVRDKFEQLQSSVPKKTFTPAQQKQMDLIIEGDPATKITGGLGNYLSNKMVSAASSIPGFSSGSYLTGLLAPLAMEVTGRGLKELSAGGTREAVRDMRRMMYPSIDKFKPPVDAGDAAKFTQALRQLGLF